MSGRLLVTVVGPAGRPVDLAVPSGVPVAELLGGLAAALADQPPAGRAVLARRGGAPLPPERTLADCGVADGEVLTLEADSRRPGGLPAPAPASGAAGTWPPAGRSAAVRPAPADLAGPPAPWRSRRGYRSATSASGTPLPVPRPAGDPAAASPPGAAGLAGPPPPGPLRARLGGALAALAGGGNGDGPRGRLRPAWHAGGHERWLAAAVAAPVPDRCACIGVVGATPRAGTTTVAVLLAAVFAGGRAGRTVAVDTSPGPGSLTELLAPGHDLDAGDLLGLLGHPDLSGPELRAVLARRGALAVLAATAPLDARAWTGAVGVLKRHATTVVVDCGLGVAAAGTRAAVATADQFVLVTDPRSATATLLAAEGLAALGRPPVVVVNRAAGQLDAATVLERVPSARGAVLLPDDPGAARALEAGPAPATAPLDWARLPGLWRRQACELAVLLLADWPLLGLASVPDQLRGARVEQGKA